MRFRPIALRLLAALVAVVQGFAPAFASLVDAQPAARAIAEQAKAHVEAPDAPHAYAHRDHCVLCSAATHLDGVPTASTPVIAATVGLWPARAARFARFGAAARAHSRTRAPPA